MKGGILNLDTNVKYRIWTKRLNLECGQKMRKIFLRKVFEVSTQQWEKSGRDQQCKKDVVGSKLMLRASAFNVFSHNIFNKSQLFSLFFVKFRLRNFSKFGKLWNANLVDKCRHEHYSVGKP